jgi:UDP-N-acetylmuramoyl-tripeptide--D-alanyl-D-alanine ligase
MYSSITFQKLAEWVGGELTSSVSTHFGVVNISTDTRTLKPGDVYLALKGESFDGNLFLKEAVKAGAQGIICQTTEPVGVPKIRVKDSLQALISIGEKLRTIFQGPVFAITGSAGKSSTKDMVAVLLGDKTVSSPASFNNLMGVSRTLCLLEDQSKNLVLEMGMNNFGEIAELCQRFRPHYGMITNIGDAHIGKLGGQAGIFRAKKEMFDFLSKDPNSLGIALNADDSWVMEAFKSNFHQGERKDFTVKTYSLKEKTADVFLESSMMDPETGFLNLKITSSGESFSASLPIFGEHQAQNIIAAVAMVQLAGVSVSDFKSRLSKIRPAPHRGEIVSLSENKVVIDETYNSNPKALKSSLKSLKKISPNRRKVLVLGEMRELGTYSESLHEDIGDYLVEWVKADNPLLRLITVQGDAKKISDRVKSLCPQITVDHFSSVQEVIKSLPELLSPKDIIFLKGSRGVKLDLILNSLK